MRKQIPQIDLILDIVSRYPDGASVEEILVGLDPTLSRRFSAVLAQPKCQN